MISRISEKINDKILFMSQYGSVSYNTNNEDSDVDWRAYIKYNNKDTIVVQDGNNDICVNGINQFKNMVVGMNYRAIESLFSPEILFNEENALYIQKQITKIFEMKNKIVIMDTYKLYKSYMREYEKYLELAEKSENIPNKMKYIKYSFKYINVLERFHKTNFTNYNYAMRYDDHDVTRYFIKSINQQKIPYDKALKKTLALNEKVKKIKKDFNRPVNNNTRKVFIMLCENIGGEMNGM